MHIDIVHDTACPWCRIGKHNLATALAAWQGEPVTLRYLTYFLNPDMPTQGRPYLEHMASKFPGMDIRQLNENPTRAGAAAGLVFDFDSIERSPNTVLSHRLIALSPDDTREAVVEAIYDAYFQHGKDIGQMAVLLDVAESVGLDRGETERMLQSDAAEKEVIEQAAQMYESGVSGVPLFIFNGKWALNGAQPVHVFSQVLDKVAREQVE